MEAGATVDVGTLLATIETGAIAGEAHPDEEAPDSRQGQTLRHARPPTSEPSGSRRVSGPISPVVRRIADEHGVELELVTGTGRRGRVTKKDILAFIEAGNGEPAERPLHTESPYREEPEPLPTAAGEAGDLPSGEGEPLSLMRKQIGEHMVRSIQTAAHCTTIVEADMSAIEAARGKLSYLPLVAKATGSPRCASTRSSTRRWRATGSYSTRRCTSGSPSPWATTG